MNFGEVTDQLLPTIDFSLPADGLQTKKTFGRLKAVGDPEYYVGCAKWGRKEWVDLIYPSGTKEADFLNEYVKHFNSIELNAAFYRLPKTDQIRKWKIAAEQNAVSKFKFIPKFSRLITHMKRLKNTEDYTDLYLNSISEFGDFLGPCFIQLADNFSPDNFEVLEKYLTYLPSDMAVFVELRHERWFADHEIRENVLELLSTLKKGIVITDTSGRRDLVHMELTIPEVLIRFVGNGVAHQALDYARIDAWIARIKEWIGQGLKKVYFFLHQHDEKDTPLLANYTIHQFNIHLKSNLAELKFITK